MKNNRMKLDKSFYIGCVPVHVSPNHPTDQTPCIQEDCPHCKRPMWVSEKKRAMRKKIPTAKIYCLECLTLSALDEGLEPELIVI